MSSVLLSSQTSFNEVMFLSTPPFQTAQVFDMPSDYHRIDSVEVYLGRYGEPEGLYYVAIYGVDGNNNPAGNKLVEVAKHPINDIAPMGGNYEGAAWYTFSFNPINVNRYGTYAIVLRQSRADLHTGNWIGDGWNDFGTSQTYPAKYTSGSMSSWETMGSNRKLTYRVYGSLVNPTITSSSVSFTTGNNIPITFNNPGLYNIRAEVRVNGTLIKTQDMGAVTSGTITFNSSQISNMYAQIPNSTSCSMSVKILSYVHSNYTYGIGSHTKTGTMSINQNINTPTFTTFTVANVDKTITNKDKYNNTLSSNSTSTLLGSNSKMITGYSKLRATITSANKMVPKNHATGVKYRFTNHTKHRDENYSSSNTVNLDIDNAVYFTCKVRAYDSRGLTKEVTNTSWNDNKADYVSVSLWGMTLTRDNGVDAPTKLAFSGSYWNEYFGGGTSGVQNTITAHYRYKESTASWGSQTWNAITVTDTDGSLSYDEYIEGDLGVGGFDAEKSFDIEVRVYDKLTNSISEQTLSVGTPLIDLTPDGVAFGDRYDTLEGGDLQLLGKNILDIIYPVGSIYINKTSSTNPATLLGFGTWSAVGEGRVLVGKASSGTFSTAGATMGSENVTLTAAQSGVPAHNHGSTGNPSANHSHGVSITSGTISANHFHNGYGMGRLHSLRWNNTGIAYNYVRSSWNNGARITNTVSANHTHSVSGNTGTVSSWHTHSVSNNTAANAANSHTNIQPSLVVYMWERVS